VTAKNRRSLLNGAGCNGIVIASEAKQSISRHNGQMDCFVAYSPLRKRFAFVAGNDEETSLPQ